MKTRLRNAAASTVRLAVVAALLPLLAAPPQAWAAETSPEAVHGLLLPDAPAPAPAGKLTITILEGEGALNNISARDAREPIVQITDENHKPVSGVSVVFLLHSGSSGAGGGFLPASSGTLGSAASVQPAVAANSAATEAGINGGAGANGASGAAGTAANTESSGISTLSNGDQAFTTRTDANGRARAHFKPNDLLGLFVIAVFASSDGRDGAAVIHMENVRGAFIAKGGFHNFTHGGPLAAAIVTIATLVVVAVVVGTNSGSSTTDSGSATTITTGPGGVNNPGIARGHGVSFSFGGRR